MRTAIWPAFCKCSQLVHEVNHRLSFVHFQVGHFSLRDLVCRLCLLLNGLRGVVVIVGRGGQRNRIQRTGQPKLLNGEMRQIQYPARLKFSSLWMSYGMCSGGPLGSWANSLSARLESSQARRNLFRLVWLVGIVVHCPVRLRSLDVVWSC